jgi:transcription elongation factor Elf1
MSALQSADVDPSIEPEKTAEDDRMFQCPRCEHSQNIAIPQKQKLVQRR